MKVAGMMRDFALMVGDEVVTIVASSRPLDELRGLYPDYDLRRLDEVPEDALRQFRDQL